MTTRSILLFSVPTLVLAAGLFADARTSAAPPAAPAEQIARGKYLVTIGHCNDCHTPFKIGPRGPEPDMARALTGHPAEAALPPPPAMSGAWNWAGAATGTAFAGPWGVSFPANLTPDEETGLGKWTERMFIDTMRTGRHQGKGRPIMPPMPYQNVGAMTDDDIKALFAYLQSLPPVRNEVPAPIDPPEAAGQ
jgi:mono/diheme cytochrome c family protein